MTTLTTGKATEFIQFTRASNATVTDSDGKVKWAPHNLLTNSESFDNANWAKSSATVTANSVAAPNGTTTADLIQFSATGGRIGQVVALTSGQTFTFGIAIRVASGTRNYQITDNAATPAVLGTITATTSWQFLSVSFAGTGEGAIRLVDNNASGFVDTYIWGAALYRSDLGGMQPNTSAYPMYNPTTPKNLLGYTEDFGNAAWGGVNLLAFGSGSTLNAAGAPNGINTADKIVESTAAGIHSIAQTVTTTASVRTFSVYLKRAERSFAMLYHGVSNAGIAINLDTGATNTPVGIAAPVSSSAPPVGDGWYRCSISVNATAGANAFGVYLMPSSSSYSYTGDGTSGIYLWGAQLSDSASLDPYVPVYGAAVTSAAYYGPRRDFDPVTLACKGLLVEEQRANLLTFSAQFDDAAWSKNGTASITADTTVAPDGTITADTLTGAAGNPSSGTTDTMSRSPVVSSSTAYTASLYVKGITGTTVTLLLRDGSTGTVSSAIATLTSSWQRISCTLTSGAATTGFSLRIGGANGTVAIWGAQLEAGSFATSYIPTVASSATRNADVASVSTQAFPYSATEGAIVVNVVPFALNGVAYALDDGTTSNRIQSQLNVSQFHFYIDVGAAQQVNMGFGTLSAGTQYKIAGAYKANDFAGAMNGGTVVTDSAGSIPAVNTLSLGRVATAGYLNGHIRQITYLPRRISNTELQTRTA